jgi:TubC N-terminal docking domain
MIPTSTEPRIIDNYSRVPAREPSKEHPDKRKRVKERLYDELHQHYRFGRIVTNFTAGEWCQKLGCGPTTFFGALKSLVDDGSIGKSYKHGRRRIHFRPRFPGRAEPITSDGPTATSQPRNDKRAEDAAVALIVEAKTQEVQLYVESDTLMKRELVDGATLTPDLYQRIKSNQAAVIQFLSRRKRE